MANFIKKVENFVCGNCGENVIGNGFTNHCPKCLWGKHVDINPGDRAESCGGMMEPIEIISEREGDSVVHKCTICGKIRKNRLSKEDNFDKAIEISQKRADKFSK